MVGGRCSAISLRAFIFVPVAGLAGSEPRVLEGSQPARGRSKDVRGLDLAHRPGTSTLKAHSHSTVCLPVLCYVTSVHFESCKNIRALYEAWQPVQGVASHMTHKA